MKTDVFVSFSQHDMEIDERTDENLERLVDEALKRDTTKCPSIKIEPIGDASKLPNASSQEDTAAEEKNDSGIR